MGEEVRRQVGIEVYSRLVDTHYDNSIASLSRWIVWSALY